MRGHNTVVFNKFVFGLMLACTLSACSKEDVSSADFRAIGVDTILTNGKIYTLNESRPVAESIAISGGEIVAVGATDDIEAMAGAETRVIDLDGQTVLPGFHDLHVHPLGAGVAEVRCSIRQGSTMNEALDAVKACSESVGEGSWVTGGQWDVSALGQVPTRQMLDSVVPDKPVMLTDTSGHSVWVNSKALEVGGVTAETASPPGGIIEHDAQGWPSGVLHESAKVLVSAHVPPPSNEVLDTAIRWSISTMLANGITSYTDAAIGFIAGPERETEAYTRLADAGLLKQRTRLCITWRPGDDEADTVIAERANYERNGLSLDCVKLFVDGVPTDSHTAAMLEPYEGKIEGRTDEAAMKGLLLIDQTKLNETVARFDAMGLTVKFHSAGDAAVRAGLDAIEYARAENGPNDSRHNVGHCTFVSAEDMPRAEDIGATFEVSPYLWSPSPINDSITSAVGDEMIKRVWPVRELLDSGALVVAGSDWSVVPSVNPWLAVEALVTREEPGGSARNFGKEQAITLDEAIELFTINSAKHMGTQDRLGKIKVGMLADLIVLDRDPYAIPITELHQVVVSQTIINGETVYEK